MNSIHMSTDENQNEPLIDRLTGIWNLLKRRPTNSWEAPRVDEMVQLELSFADDQRDPF